MYLSNFGIDLHRFFKGCNSIIVKVCLFDYLICFAFMSVKLLVSFSPKEYESVSSTNTGNILTVTRRFSYYVSQLV